MIHSGKTIAYFLASFFILSTAQADTFTPAEFIEDSDKFFTMYPVTELKAARTARIWISYIVTKDGTVSEPMIEQSNNRRFDKAVMKWMKSLRFVPATIDGVPIDSLKRDRRAFDIGYDQRSGRISTTRFNTLNKKFGEEINKSQPDAKKLKKLLRKLTKSRHGSALAYEYIALRRYQFAKKFLNRDAQIYAIRERMLASDRRSVWYQGTIVDEELIQLLLDAAYFGEAIEAYYNARRKLNSNGRSELWQRFGRDIKRIKEIMDSNEVFSRPISITGYGYSFVPLVKRTIKLSAVEGTIDTIKLRCERHFSEHQFVADSEFSIPEIWGACQLQVLGTPGSHAQLIQQ